MRYIKMCSRNSRKGSITIEASLVFLVFIAGYLILNAISLSLMTESLTRKALFETGLDLSNYIQIIDRAGLVDSVSTTEIDRSKYKDILIKGLGSDSGDSAKNIFDNLISIAKGEISSKAQKYFYNTVIKNIFLSKLKSIRPDYNIVDLGIIGGSNGFKFTDTKILENGNQISLNLKYDFKIDRLGLTGIKNEISQNLVIDTWINRLKNTTFDSIWDETNFERGRFFASKIRGESDISIKTGHGFDYYIKDSDTLVQVISLNVFNKTYSEKQGEKYLIKDELIKQIKNYYKTSLENYEKYNGKIESKNGETIDTSKSNIKLELILPEETIEYTNLENYISQINKIGNISFKYLEKAIDD